DCLAERLDWISRAMPHGGAYAEGQRAIAAAAARLHALSGRYHDPALPRHRYAAPGGPRPQANARVLTPIRPADMSAANRAASAIIAEAETVLLRSSATAGPVAPQLRDIAAAVASNKALLRST